MPTIVGVMRILTERKDWQHTRNAPTPENGKNTPTEPPLKPHIGKSTPANQTPRKAPRAVYLRSKWTATKRSAVGKNKGSTNDPKSKERNRLSPDPLKVSRRRLNPTHTPRPHGGRREANPARGGGGWVGWCYG